MILPSLPLRMLLTTDGSVTALLEASFRSPVAVETVTNAVDGARPRSLRRTAAGPYRHRHHRRSALLDGDAPIGSVLRDARLETRRELGPYVEDTATADDAAALGVDEGSPVFERTYRIMSFSRELAVVTERVPASLFDAVPA